ncbi:MAG: hypothetical protein RLN60_00965 [Phycisphaerales bacterium]
MHIFLLYAVVVWYLSFRYRRRWRAVFVLGIGVPLVPFVLRLYYLIFTGRFFTPEALMMDLISLAYAGVLLLIGAFLALIPREHASFPCKYCRYDLIGNITGRCPECGSEIPHSMQVAIADELEHNPRPTGDELQPLV